MHHRSRIIAVACVFISLGIITLGSAQTVISVGGLTNRHSISPYIYGAANGTRAQVLDLNLPIERYGGNESSSYNWLLNAAAKGTDWYFETFPDDVSSPGFRADSILTDCKANNAQAMVTIPMLNYVGTLGPGRSNTWSFSVSKYGPQTASDGDAGDGISTASGNPYITGNNPLDGNVPNSPAMELSWVQQIVSTWGLSDAGGLKFYIMDNEPSLWNSTHRDVHPVGERYDEIYNDYVTYALNVRNSDPNAVIFGPEEWGWTGYFYSGFDAAWGSANGWSGAFPDMSTHGNLYHIPWILQSLKNYQTANGKQLLNVLSVHYYPQSGEYGNDDSPSMQAIRNQSTRSLWDPAYADLSWIGGTLQGPYVELIPRLKNWVSTYYPGLQTAITEYNWGDEGELNGATAQADIYGIFGREGLDYASRWGVPATDCPVYLAMQMYRNYDGHDSGFGDVSVACTVPNPNALSAFASQRSSDGAITVMVVNKVTTSAPVRIRLTGLPALGLAQVYQLSNPNQTSINRLSNLITSGGVINTTVPAQSVTIFVIPSERLSLTVPNPGQLTASPGGTVTYPVIAADLGNPGAAISGVVLHGPTWAHYDGTTLTLSPPSGTLTGDYPIEIEAVEGGSDPQTATTSFMILTAAPQLQSATFSSSVVNSGSSATLTVSLSTPAPQGGCSISLVPSSYLSVSSPQTIPAGSRSVTISVSAGSVARPILAEVMVSFGGRSIPAFIRIMP
jgi:hypothetical protein